MKRSQSVLLRKMEDGGALLCPVRDYDGTVERINATGVFLWQALEEETTLDGLLQKMQRRYPGTDAMRLERDAREFLGGLQLRGFLSGYDGELRKPLQIRQDLGEGVFSYRGGSMNGVFVPGDCLEVEPVPFESLHAGDVVVYMRGNDGVRVAHRVVGNVTGGLVTMGDANPSADSTVVTREMQPRLVRWRILPTGERKPVARGWRGRVIFCRNRLKYHLGRVMRWMGRHLAGRE